MLRSTPRWIAMRPATTPRFGEVYDKLSPRLFGYLLRHTRDHADVAQLGEVLPRTRDDMSMTSSDSGSA